MPFQVIFEGLKDNTPEQKELVKSKLIEKFKLPPEKAERMMVSAPIVVKKGLNQDQANKYKSALESIGAIATVRLVPDETDLPPEQSSTPIDQAPIPAKSVQPQPTTSPVIEQPAEIKISESKPLPPLFQEPEAPAQKPNPLESDYPIFHGESTPSPESAKPVAETNDPYKTNVQASQVPKANEPPLEALTIQQPPSSAAKTTNISGEWWQTVQILNPPFDEAAKSVTPISSGRISANDVGFSISHPMIERIPFGDVQIISACQIGTGANPRLYVDIFISSTPRPIRLDLDLMNFATFGLTRPDDPAERLASAVTALIDRNHFLTLDLATYKLLKDKSKVKIVASDRDIEKYCGKLQIEVDKGLSIEVNPNIISCQQANELLNSTDPWGSAPPPAFSYPGQVPPTVFTPGMPGMPPPMGFPNAPGQMMPPEAYNTQPVRPPNTVPGISQNPTQMAAPPVRSPQPPQQAPPQPYASPYLQQPPNNPNPAYPPPPAPGFGQQQNPYAPPQNRPYAPPQMAPDQKGQFPYAPPMPGQPPAVYQPPGFPAQGQFPVSSPMGQYNNPSMSNEVNKAFEEANTALILSIVGFLCGCLSPLAIVGLIKAQNALKIFDQYGIQQNRNKAMWAKGISIVALIFYAITLLSWFIR